MKYKTNCQNIKPGTKLWACAYKFDNNKTTMGLIQKPIYGMARGYGWDYEGTMEENSYSSFFVPFKSGSEIDFAKSKAVRITSRVYADTYEECVELFNKLVEDRVAWFKKRATETEKDIIELNTSKKVEFTKEVYIPPAYHIPEYIKKIYVPAIPVSKS